MTILLVHGATFTCSQWDRLLPYLQEPVVTFDLPGRGSRPRDLSSLTLDDFANTLIDEVKQDGREGVVVVGVSLASLTMLRAAARIAPRVSRYVFVGCPVPPDGGAFSDLIGTGRSRDAQSYSMTREQIASKWCNDMDEPTREWALDRRVPDAAGIRAELVYLNGLRSIPVTYVRLLRDLAFTAGQQSETIRMLTTWVQSMRVVDLDAGHLPMISCPRQLAAILSS